MQPWYQHTRRWAQTNFTEDDPASADLSFWREQWRRNRAQGVIINCGGIVAYYPSKYPLHYRAKTLGERDFFGEVSAMAREEGMAVIARMDVNRVAEDMAAAHPEWLCRDSAGAPILSNGRYYVCVNSGYYHSFVPDILTEIIQRYHPDGFADNNWKGLDRRTVCHCENCRKGFLAFCGKDLPQTANWSDAAYGDWVRWNYQLRLGIWDRFNSVTQAVGGDDCLWCGMLNADVVERAQRFVDLKAVLARSKIIFSDQQGRGQYGFEENSISGTLLRLASDESILVPESMANYTRGRRTFRLSANPPAETRLWMLDGIAGGISPWFHFVGGGQRDRRQFETPVPVTNWHAENEEYLYDRRDMATVGIVWSQENADFYGRDDMRERVTLPWRGMTRAMLRRRISFLPIHAGDIAQYAGRIRTLVLPDVAVLDDVQTQAVIDFARNGGNLVISGMTGTLDGEGNRLTDMPLWDALGLALAKGFEGVSANRDLNWEQFDAHTYIRVTEKNHPIYEGFENADILPFGGRYCRVESTGALRPLCGYIPSFPIFPPEFSWIRGEDASLSLLFAGQLAGGGRCAYLAGDFDRCYGKDLLPDHGALLGNIIAWAAGDTLPFRVEGPGELDCKLYRQENRRILHLVNLSGACRTPGYAEEMLPVGPVTVSLPLGDASIARVEARVRGEGLSWSLENGRLEIAIPSIIDHEMLVLEEV